MKDLPAGLVEGHRKHLKEVHATENRDPVLRELWGEPKRRSPELNPSWGSEGHDDLCFERVRQHPGGEPDVAGSARAVWRRLEVLVRNTERRCDAIWQEGLVGSTIDNACNG